MNQCFAQIPQIKGVIFVMDGMLKDANSVNDHKIIGLFVLWDEMYMKSCEEPTESSLAEFKVKKSSKLFHSNLQLSKLHSWLFHINETIRQFDLSMICRKYILDTIAQIINLNLKLHLPDSIIAHSDNYCHDKPEFSNVAIEMAESKNDECIPDEIY
ncbi:3414_t:CDS:2, partial [Entrophospora sp. SA101]